MFTLLFIRSKKKNKYVDIYTKYFDNFFAWPFNLDFYVNSNSFMFDGSVLLILYMTITYCW